MTILDTLCEKFVLDRDTLMAFAITAPYRYKLYKIPKRNGSGFRVIAHPSRELKIFQRSASEILEAILPVHDSAHAYKQGASITKNAKQHQHCRYLLKIDFQNFFPSITPDIFFKTLDLSDIHLAREDRRLLKFILFRKSIYEKDFHLSIGAPSSPLISNFVMFPFDKLISEGSKNLSVVYTRYADDLTFSSKKRIDPNSLTSLVEKELQSIYGDALKINTHKTVYTSKKHNRHVTGVTLTNDNKLSIGRERKRRISAMIHRHIVVGLPEQELERLKGFLAFARSVEPTFYTRMTRKYGSDAIYRILAPKVFHKDS